MAWKLKPGEPAGAGVLRLVARDLRRVVADVGSANGLSDECVHAIRRRLKRSRAALRVIDEPSARVLRSKLRAVAALLAPVRDAAVAATVSASLGLSWRPPPPVADGTIRGRLIRRGSAILGWMERIEPPPPGRLRRALRRARRRMEAAFARCRAEGADPAAFHAWRKRLKDWQVLRALAGRRRGRHRMARLLDVLGAINDLTLVEASGNGRVESRRAELIPEALALGARLHGR